MRIHAAGVNPDEQDEHIDAALLGEPETQRCAPSRNRFNHGASTILMIYAVRNQTPSSAAIKRTFARQYARRES
jgi:hypothetical protein